LTTVPAGQSNDDQASEGIMVGLTLGETSINPMFDFF
jgi:hypothetical protein